MTLRTGLGSLVSPDFAHAAKTARSDSVGKGSGLAPQVARDASMRLLPPYRAVDRNPTLLTEPRQIETSRQRHAVVSERQSGAVLEQCGIPEWGEAIFDRRIGVVAVVLGATLGLGAG